MPRRFRFLAAAAVALLAFPAPAQLAQPPEGPLSTPQRLQLAATWGWQVNGDVNGYYGKLVVEDAQSLGISAQIGLRPGTRLELSWLTSNTRAKVDSYSAEFVSTRPFSVAVNYFQLGGVQAVRRGALEFFAGGSLGAVWFSPERIEDLTGATYYASDTWRFAVSLGAGANVFVTPALALRLHARMLVPVYFQGGGFYAGTGGSGVSVNAGVPAIGGDFAVGLAYAH